MRPSVSSRRRRRRAPLDRAARDRPRAPSCRVAREDLLDAPRPRRRPRPGSTRSRLDTRVTERPEFAVGAGELGPGDARADHDEVLGQLGQVVDLLPGQDPLAVRLRAGQHPRRARRWRSARRRRRPSPRRRRRPSSRSGAGPVEAAACPGSTRTPSPRAGARCRRTAPRASALIRPLTAARSTSTSRPARRPSGPRARRLRGGQRPRPVAISVLLGTQSVSTQAAEPVAVDDRDLRAELGGDQRRLVAAGSATEDHDARHAGHSPVRRAASPRPVHREPCTPRTGRTWTRRRCSALPALAAAPAPAGSTAGASPSAARSSAGRVPLPMVVEDRAAQVFVALYDIAPSDRATLDRWESRRRASTTDPGAGVDARRATCWPGCTCSTATRAACRRRATSGLMADAADAAGAPDDYVAELRSRPCRSVGP